MKALLAVVVFFTLLKMLPAASHINNEFPAPPAPEPPLVEQMTLPSVVPTPETVVEVPQSETQPQAATGCDSYRTEFEKYAWDTSVMIRICKCESSGNPSIVGDGHLTYFVNDTRYGYSVGLLQIRFLPGREHYGDLTNPSTNISAGYDIFTRQGYKAWTCYHKI
jgi:hypothetical protein